MKRLILIILVLAFISAPAFSQVISGRLFTSFYSWEREVFGAGAEKYTQTYNGAIFHVRELGHKNLSFHTYVRMGNTLVGEGLDMDHKLYNAYFEWTDIGDRADLTVGRQFVWAGVGNGTMDGAKVEVDLQKYGKIGAYAGTLAPLRESWKLDSWSKSNMLGAYYRGSLQETDFQLSWVRKERESSKFSIPFGGSTQTFGGYGLTAQLIGLDASRKITDKVKLFIRTEGTLPGTHRELNLDRFEATADFAVTPRLTVSGQYYYRNPRQNLNSIFSYFSQVNNQEFWFNAYYRLNSTWSLYGGWAHIAFDTDNSQRLNLGFSSQYLSGGFYKYTAYSGDMDNFTLAGQYPVRENLWVKCTAGIGRYKVHDDYSDYNNLITSSAGISYKPRQSVSFDIEGQNLKNSLSKSDFRLYGRINYWFFVRNTGN